MSSKVDYHKPGDILLSPGGSFVYEVKSHPVCRLYYDNTPDAKYPLQPHQFEYNPNKSKGGRDFVSYVVSLLGSKQEFLITDACLIKQNRDNSEQG